MNLTVTRLVYTALVSHADADGYVENVSQRQLAEDTGLDTTLVAAAIRILAHDNYVQRHGHSQGTNTTTYRVAPPVAEPVRPELRLIRGGKSA